MVLHNAYAFVLVLGSCDSRQPPPPIPSKLLIGTLTTSWCWQSILQEFQRLAKNPSPSFETAQKLAIYLLEAGNKDKNMIT